MVGWHHRLNGPESEQTPGDSEGQRSLACGSSRGCKESATTGRLNNNNTAQSAVVQYLYFKPRMSGSKLKAAVTWLVHHC